jgi:DNA-binding NarL/FixJ family response regulator
MIMPRKSGQETYLEMKRIEPGLRVIVSSGFKLDEKVQGMFTAGVRSFIQKPYTLEKLARAFAEVLGGRP